MKTHKNNNAHISLQEVSDNSDIGFEHHTNYDEWNMYNIIHVNVLII